MNTLLYWLVVIVIAWLLHYFDILKISHHPQLTQQEKQQKQQHFNIVVGILSSRQNFAQREVVRYGIKQQSSNLSILVKFIVSKHPCEIPVEDRINVHSCKASAFLKPTDDSFYFHHVTKHKTEEEFVPEGPVGFDFMVNHEITVGDLGFFDNNGDGIKGSLKVILYETPTKKQILSTTFLPFALRGLLNTGLHVYKHGKTMVLPKGFRGSIVIEGSTENDPLVRTRNCVIDDGGGLITYIHGYRYATMEGYFPEHINTHVNSYCYYAGASFIYSAYNISVTANASILATDRKERYHKLRNQLNYERVLLQNEQEEHKDLLFVDNVESYRSLPRKMLLFYEWLHLKDFNYMMKTDDDCYINITAISHFILQLERHDVWIGNFHIYFPLDLHGKWEEHEYKSITYPPFACGSGYILSTEIVHWIFLNQRYLKSYQGEDVSLGIWLSAIHLTRVDDPRFLCFASHRRNIFSSPNNNLSHLKSLYGFKDSIS